MVPVNCGAEGVCGEGGNIDAESHCYCAPRLTEKGQSFSQRKTLQEDEAFKYLSLKVERGCIVNTAPAPVVWSREGGGLALW